MPHESSSWLKGEPMKPLITSQGKGKSPTKLIFDVKEFIEGYGKSKKDRLYIFPKKGELRCGNCMKKNEEHSRFYDDHDYKSFRLSSDAVLKSVGDYINLKECNHLPRECYCGDHECFSCEIGSILESPKYNLSENSKIVITEGYYE